MFGGKCQPDPNCILNQAVKDESGKVITFKELSGYSGNRGCCNPGSDGSGGDVSFPQECVGSSDNNQSGPDNQYGPGCNLPRNDYGRPVTLYNKLNKKVSAVDKCSRCGDYHYSDGIVCRKLSPISDLPNTCGDGEIIDDSYCGKKSLKSNFGKKSNNMPNPMMCILIMIVLILLLLVLFKNPKTSFFGKRR
jgi:hypothetical protein